MIAYWSTVSVDQEAIGIFQRKFVLKQIGIFQHTKKAQCKHGPSAN